MRRLCIFAFYHSKGCVKPYVEHLLGELAECSSHLIFVGNSKLDEESRKLVLRYTPDIYIRNNIGYDYGAYKDVICNYLNGDLSQYDEVMFCNNSFYGFFCPLKEIISNMKERSSSDFWGLCYTEYNFANHIPAMFMFYGKRVIKNNLLQIFMNLYGDEFYSNKNVIIAEYEIGLFDFLVRINNMKYDCYSNLHNLNIYNSASECVVKYGFPILKRRIGEKECFIKNDVIKILNYIKKYTNYDIKMIVDDMMDEYGVHIDIDDIGGIVYNKKNEKSNVPILPAKYSYYDIKKIIEDKKFYIMGAGIMGVITWQLFARNNKKFLGFVVSDGQKISDDTFLGSKICHYSDISLDSTYLLVAMQLKHSVDVRKTLGESKYILYMWE